ncbi:hypothetical protein LA345_39245 (plasmid) [Burkholderia vietnamiensis]|nr:hypothetical protein [Burkholderia vietnamiensis]
MTERTDAYEEGREAYRLGFSDADNPHLNGSDESMDWFDGFNDEERGANHAE